MVKEVKKSQSVSFQTIGRESDKLLAASPLLISLLSFKVDKNALLTKYLCIIYYVMYYDYLLLKLCELFNPTQQQISQLQVVRELGLKLRWIIHRVCGDLFKDKVYTLFAMKTAPFITLCILKDYAFGPQQYSGQALENYGADISKLFESTLKRPNY